MQQFWKAHYGNSVTGKIDVQIPCYGSEDGGGRWIRTTVRETRADLQSAAFDRSAIPPTISKKP